MARTENEEIPGVRDILDYRKSFDVFLACDFESQNGKQRIPFYERIGEIIFGLGKRPFLPHREIDLKEDPGKLVSIIQGIVIPSSDIVLAYLGGEPMSTGMMMGWASAKGIPLSYLYHENSQALEGLKVGLVSIDTKKRKTKTRVVDMGFHRGVEVYDLIEFGSDNEALIKIESSLKAFYKEYKQ